MKNHPPPESASASPRPSRVYRLRPDLELIPWDDAGNGRPRWLVRDPMSNSLERVEWPECILLLELREGATIGKLAEAVASGTTLRPDKRDVFDYLRRLAARGWLREIPFPANPPASARGKSMLSASWWVSHYLYFRVDLWNPDAFLEKSLPFARLLASWPVLAALAVSAALGLYLALPRWEEFGLGVARLAVWSQVAWIIPAVACIKLFHEFAHAYAAKAAGARVDAMGIAMVLLFPLPFARVTDAWRLPGKRRFLVAAAGILTELAVAALALPAWAMAPPGMGKDLCLMAASTALLSTLLINLNPGARFDGYFMLSHLLGVENLQARSAARLAWLWRRWFWGVGRPDPARDLPRGERIGLTAYAAYAWCYRLTLYLGMALVAYGRLPKALGILMVTAVVLSFLVRPAVAETMRLWRMRAEMNWRGAATLFLVAGVAVWAGMALPRRVAAPAIARAGNAIPITVVRGGQVLETATAADIPVTAGQVLARIRSRDIDAEVNRTDWAEEEAKRAAELSRLTPEARRQLLPRTALALARKESGQALRTRTSLNDLRAPADGMVAEWEPWIHPGVFVPGGAVLGWVVRPEVPLAIGLVEVAAASRLRPGTRARFIADDNSEAIAGVLLRVERNRLESVVDGALAAAASARLDRGVWRLERPMLRIVVELERPHPRNGQSGRLWLDSEPYSLLADAWNWLRALAVRESGF